MGLYDELRGLVSDPDTIAGAAEELRFIGESDDPEEMAQALSNGDMERALDVSGYEEEEFVERLETIDGYFSTVEDRYDTDILDDVTADDLQDELGISDDEYRQMLHGAVLRQFEDSDEYR